METLKYGKKKALTIIASLTCSIVFLGFGCGVGFDSASWVGELGVKNNSSNGILPTLGEETIVDITPNAKTVSVVNFETVLESMAAQTGETPNKTTIDRFRARLGLFSETGAVSTVNSSMLWATTTIAGEFCRQLINTEYEQGLLPGQRRFFNRDLSNRGDLVASSTLLQPEVFQEVVRRMARSFWQRNEDPEELQMLTTALSEVIAAEPRINSRRAGLFLCTAMLSSTAAIEI